MFELAILLLLMFACIYFDFKVCEIIEMIKKLNKKLDKKLEIEGDKNG